jgi:hypothetical protein
MPLLRELIQLDSHLRICETVLEEEGIPLERLQSKVGIVETFRDIAALHQAAMPMLHLEWPTIKATLLAEFCDQNLMRAELESKLTVRRFDSKDSVGFLHEARRLASLAGPDIDRRWFVSELFKPLPDDLLEAVIFAARKKDKGADWRTQDVTLLLEYLSDAIISRNAVHAVKGVPPATKGDRVNYAGETGMRTAQIPSKGGMSVRDWIEKHKESIFYTRTTDGKKLAQLREKAKEVKECRKRDGSKYNLACFQSKEEGKEIMEGIFQPSEFRYFVANSAKN